MLSITFVYLFRITWGTRSVSQLKSREQCDIKVISNNNNNKDESKETARRSAENIWEKKQQKKKKATTTTTTILKFAEIYSGSKQTCFMSLFYQLLYERNTLALSSPRHCHILRTRSLPMKSRKRQAHDVKHLISLPHMLALFLTLMT